MATGAHFEVLTRAPTDRDVEMVTKHAEGLLARNRKLEVQLKRNEWYYDEDYGVSRCPECGCAREADEAGEGHEKGCKLKELLDGS